MNGARSTFMRQGHLITALAVAVLLAASSGTAQAQAPVTIDIKSVKVDAATSAGKVPEGTVTSVTVVLDTTVPLGESVLVDLVLSGNDGLEGNAETGTTDIVLGTNGTAMVTVPSGRDRASAQMIVNHDVDAVNEDFLITANNLRNGTSTTNEEVVSGTSTPTTPSTGEIVDDEVQTYVMTTVTPQASIQEGAVGVALQLRADPPRPTAEEVRVYLRADTSGYKIPEMVGTDGNMLSGVDLNFDNNSTAPVTVNTPPNDKNRTDDTVTLTGFTGTVVSNKAVVTHSITVIDIFQLPAADTITAEAKDAKVDGTTAMSVTEGEKVYVWVTVGNSTRDKVSDTEVFTVSLSAANPSQTAGDFRSSPASFNVTAGPGIGDKKTVGPFELEALEDEDVGMETLMLNLNVTGQSGNGPGTSSGTFSITIEDATAKKIAPKSEEDAYPKIKSALGKDPETSVMNPGETGTIMVSDLFTVMDGYTASYGVSVEGGAVSVSASSDSITVTAGAVGESKVTVTARAKGMTAPSFLPEQTTSDVAHITFPVTVEEAAEPEPVPALPLIAQWLLGLGLMGGGARQLFRRRRQGS